LRWQQQRRECHYVAQELLFKVAKKELSKSDLSFITRHSLWDTIDFLRSNSLKIYFDKFPEN
jgi:3-methyladenine DNA glycosylase AlkD